MTSPIPLITITTSYPDEKSAHNALKILLAEWLVACGHVYKVDSAYVWKGKIEHEPEWILTMKSTPDLFERIKNEIKSKHPYETPMIIAQPIADVCADYAAWVKECVNKA